MPTRIRLRRTKGWRKPDGAVVVARPSRWGNPWKVDTFGRDGAVDRFRRYLDAREHPPSGFVDLLDYPPNREIRADLAGHDLACWCPLDQPCHADVLIEVANSPAALTERP